MSPIRPPVHRPVGWRPPEQRRRESDRSREGDRLRGRRRIERNRFVLTTNPLCVMCEAKGLTVLATEVDHRVPLFKGGSEDAENLQGLCHACHVEKTTADKREGGG